jgi:putative toxin-antitoxin system antitoxin component (TIGR02293 family)
MLTVRRNEIAQLQAFAREVWGSKTRAQRFLAEPHPLLGGRVPREVATQTKAGLRAVEQILGRLKFGSAA